MNNFWKRTLTGIAFVAVVVTAIWFQPSYNTLSALFALVCALGMHEFYTICNSNEHTKVCVAYYLVSGLVLYAAFFWYSYEGSWLLMPLYALLCVGAFILELYRNQSHPIHNLAFGFLGQLMVALPFALINLMGMLPYYFVLGLFVELWVFDTGAYVVGCRLGRHRLFERISPKKSWEGELGGMLFAGLAAWLFASLTHTSVALWLGFALIVVVAGTYGDLCESMLKRAYGVKDSGNALPGHGGILDRFDSLLLALPFAYCYFNLITNYL